VFGIIRSFEVLFNTPYGLTWLAAWLLTLILTVHGAVSSKNTDEKIWNGDQLRPEAAVIYAITMFLRWFFFGTVLACMRFGM